MFCIDRNQDILVKNYKPLSHVVFNEMMVKKAFNVSENAIFTNEDGNALRLVHVNSFDEAFPASQLVLCNKPYFLVNKIYEYISTA